MSAKIKTVSDPARLFDEADDIGHSDAFWRNQELPENIIRPTLQYSPARQETGGVQQEHSRSRKRSRGRRVTGTLATRNPLITLTITHF